jgi:BNR repeat-containing family member
MEHTPEYKKMDIDKVWAGHPVHFACQRRGDNIFMSYYSADRKLMVASYNLVTSDLQKYVLPEILGWDSHNGTSIGIDSKGFIHLSANMHSSPLIYYKSTSSLSIVGFEKVNTMTGDNEDSCTYPVFFYKADTLFFRYRSGRSGKGDTYVNVYDIKTASWSRALSTPLFNGESERNAYPSEFFIGKDGFFHLVWVWRESPDCETNHTPSYAKTKDFLTWYTASNDVIHLPIKNGEGDVIESVSVNSGLLNNCVKVGFDSTGRQIVSYFHFDTEGNTQLYNVRFEGEKWEIRQTSHWSYRWDFRGRGAIVLEIEVFPVACVSGELIQHWRHKEYGEGFWVLDENFTIIEERPLPDIYQQLTKKSNDAFINKICGSIDSGLFMTWETLPANRDKEREICDSTLLSSQLILYVDVGI